MNLLFVRGAEGDGAISPSFSTVNGSIDAPSSSLEAPIVTHHILGGRYRECFITANKYLFADLLLFESGEGDETTSPSLATEHESIDASSRRWKRPLQLITCIGGCKREQFHNGKQILVCRSFVV